MAGHECHFVELGNIPGAHNHAARVGVGFERFHQLGNLVNVAAVGGGPAAPLHAINRTQLAVGPRPFVPDADATLFEPVVVAGAGQKPEQFLDDGPQVHFFGGDQRKTFIQVKAHLVAKQALGAGAGAVPLGRARGVDQAHEIFVLRADGVGGGWLHGGVFRIGGTRRCVWSEEYFRGVSPAPGSSGSAGPGRV